MTSIRVKRPAPSTPRQRGLTMIELLVALTISILIALAAVAALIVTRQGFNTVDAASQLRDNGRFAVDLIQRVAVQTGYLDLPYLPYTATPAPVTAGMPTNPDPNIYGFNNALLATGTDPLNSPPTSRVAGADGYGSDILILRHRAGETFPGSGKSDKSMIDCSGNSRDPVTYGKYDRTVSIIHVAVSLGEPSLMCSTLADTGKFSAQPIVQGVENFQVLYGVDAVTAGVAPAAIADGVPDRFLRADQLTVAGDPVGTNANWRRVRSLRIGMVLRASPNSAQEKVAQTFYPLGAAKSSGTGVAGSAMSSASDPGTIFTPAVDGRLRHVITFTVHLRNDQGL